MKIKIFFLLLLLPGAIISITPLGKKKEVNKKATGSHLPVPEKFNAVLFEDTINKKIKNLVKGYAIAIADKDSIKARAEGGWAQDPTDGNIAMTIKIPSCIGSVTKMMSAAALLNLLEALPNAKLADPILLKLPAKWQQKYENTRVEVLTHRQLLQHKSGFWKGSVVGNLASMATLPKALFVAKREFNYSNISIFRYLITALAYPEAAAASEKNVAGLSFSKYSDKVNIDYGFPNEKYVRKHILEKGFSSIRASCRRDPDFMPKVAKGYSDRNAKAGGLTNTAAEHKAKGNHGTPQGSWYFSAEILCHFGRTLGYSNNHLTNTTLKMMFDDKKNDERFGWAGCEKHDGFEQETGQSKWLSYNGAQNGYFALLMQLPYAYVGSVLVNSSKNLTTDITGTDTGGFFKDVLMDAFYQATHAAPLAEIARHGIPENKYQEEFSMIWNSGYYPVWVDAYDVNDKTFFSTIFRPNKDNYDVKVKHHMTKESYQHEYNEWMKQKGYRLLQIDSYNDASKLTFAFIFNKKPGQPQAKPAYRGLSPQEHQTLFDKYTGNGYTPVNVSLTSVGGKKYQAAFYEKRNVAGSVLKSSLSRQEYHNMYDNMDKKHWEQVYITAYHYDGQTRFSVIWYEKSGYRSFTATRKSSSDRYQEKWETNTSNGLLTVL